MDVPDKAGLMRIMASQKKEWYLLNYLMANGHIREKRPGKNYIEFFSRVCCRRNYLGRTGAAKTENICCSQGELGTVYKGHKSV